MGEKKGSLTLSRRQFLKGSLITGAAIGIIGPGMLMKPGVANAATTSPKLTKWLDPIRNLDLLSAPGADSIPTITPGALGLGGTGVADQIFPNTTYFKITAGQYLDKLHRDLPPTKLWGYWDANRPVPVQKHLGGVIIMPRGMASRIRFTNTLPDTHIIPVDTSIPGANQAQNRMAIHIHGGLVPWVSDGGPFDWWAPNGASGLSFLNGPGGIFDNIPGQPMAAGQADYFYPNDQSTRLVWYHDHAHGITRLNAYAGLASGYLILDLAQEPLFPGQTTPGRLNGKIPSIFSTMPLVFQDKVFQTDGSLWYDSFYDPASFRLLTGGAYRTPPIPSCIPEFFGDTMLCNGTVYPYVEVEPKAYRFLMLNACNARFLNLNLLRVAQGQTEIATVNLNPNPLTPPVYFADLAVNPPGPPMVQIGTEGGYLVSEVYHPNNKPFDPATNTGNMLLGCAERSDFIIDFTGEGGNEFILYNDAPGPFPGGPPTTDYFLGNTMNPVGPDPMTGPDTRQVLKFKVKTTATAPIEPRPGPNFPILNPSSLLMDPAPLAAIPTTVTAPIPPLVPPAGTPLRDLTLNEGFDEFGRLKQMVGTTTPGLVSKGFGLDYLYRATEVVNKGATEVWRIFNLTADTHPMHFHLVNVQILSRQPFRVVRGRFVPSGAARGPEPDELGWKETCKMHPGEVISVIMRFDLPTGLPFTVPTSPRAAAMGLTDATKKYHEYVWHCHILEHEEHDMMRPLVVKE